MNTIKFDTSVCTSCKLCFQACWLDVIRWDEDEDRPYVAYPQDCVDCLYCEVTCPNEAVHVVIDYKKPMPKAY